MSRYVQIWGVYILRWWCSNCTALLECPLVEKWGKENDHFPVDVQTINSKVPFEPIGESGEEGYTPCLENTWKIINTETIQK